MATSTIMTLVLAGISLILHGLPRKGSTPATPGNPSPTPTPSPDESVDAFAGLPGLPGHPLLNALFRRKQDKSAVESLADLVRDDPDALNAVLSKVASPKP